MTTARLDQAQAAAVISRDDQQQSIRNILSPKSPFVYNYCLQTTRTTPSISSLVIVDQMQHSDATFNDRRSQQV